MSKLHVAILRGGPSNEYDVSLKTGAAIIKALSDNYSTHDIFISRDGTWHRDGAERTPDRALSGIQAVVNGLHGHYGQDGKVQQILSHLGIPYTGSDSISSALSYNKQRAKEILDQQGIKTPYFTLIKETDDMGVVSKHVFNHFFLPFVVKPVSSGSSLGVTVVKNFQDLEKALKIAFQYSDAALIEEYIRGKEASVGVIKKFRGEDLYSLFPSEIKHGEKKDFHDFNAKYSADASHTTPGNFSQPEKEELSRLAKLAHQTLGLGHYSKSDFIVTPRRGIFLLESNSLPALTPEASFQHALASVGSGLGEFLDHIIKLSLES